MAGLLDYLFDPGTYSGGGLLSRLQPSMTDIPQSQGFPGQASPLGIGGYQMPRIGDMAQFTPPPVDPGALPQNAQPAQGQLPAMQPPPAFMGSNQPGIGDRLNAGLQNFANAGGLLPALAGGISGLVSGARTDPAGVQQQNQRALFDAYKNAGLSPAQAMVAALNPQAAQSYLGGATDDIKEYNFSKQQEPGLTFKEFMNRKRATSGEYGMTPIWGTGPDGKPAVLQLGKSGDAKQSVLPQGFSLARDPIKVDGPTGTTILDPQTRQQVGFIPKDNAKKEADEKVGQARGAAQAALAGGADIDAEETKKKIKDFIDSKGFNEVFGQLDQYRPSWTMSNDGTAALARYEQLTGTAFLSAYQMLKGGGAITDIEGQKAGAAMARLNRAQSEAEAKKALEDFSDAVDIGLKKLKRAANGGVDAAAAPAPSGGSSVDDLVKKYSR